MYLKKNQGKSELFRIKIFFLEEMKFLSKNCNWNLLIGIKNYKGEFYKCNRIILHRKVSCCHDSLRIFSCWLRVYSCDFLLLEQHLWVAAWLFPHCLNMMDSAGFVAASSSALTPWQLIEMTQNQIPQEAAHGTKYCTSAEGLYVLLHADVFLGNTFRVHVPGEWFMAGSKEVGWLLTSGTDTDIDGGDSQG